MKKLSFSIALLLTFLILFVSCSKSDNEKLSDDLFKDQEADLFIKGDGDFEKIITKPLKKTDDCKFIVEGTIEFLKGGTTVAIIDFGDGECDNIATKTVDGEEFEFILEKKDKASKYTKIIVEPLIKIEGCDYIVAGIVKFVEGDKWIATIDFGDGECDDIATKYWDGGSKEFSLSKGKQ